jgi:HPt (histidine-containing phosphotransfer) domain-containing protein
VLVSDSSTVLNLDQLRDVTLDDADLMRECLHALVDDTARQLGPLAAAVAGQDAKECMRLAHYSKGACANLGASSAAVLLKQIEVQASSGNFAGCGASLDSLRQQVEYLRMEAAKL